MSPEVLSNQASTNDPNLRSCLSEPLTGFATFDTFFDGLVSLFKEPAHEKLDATQVEEPCTDPKWSFKVDVTLAVSEGHKRKISRKYKVERENGIIICEEGHSLTFTIVHKEPLRVECWTMLDQRTADFDMAGDTFAGPLLDHFSGAGVSQRMLEEYRAGRLNGAFTTGVDGWVVGHLGRAFFNVPGISDAETVSVVTSELDLYIDEETLWGKLVSHFKEAPGQGAELVEVTEVTFKHTFPSGEVRTWTLDAEKKTAAVETTTPEGEFKDKFNMVFHSGPLRLEAWATAQDGTRFTTWVHALVMQGMLDKILGHGSRKVFLHPDAPSVSSKGDKSMVTDPLDDFTDFDKLWDRLLWLLRNVVTNSSMRVKSYEILPGGTDDAFVARLVTLEHGTGSDQLVAKRQSFVADRDKGLVTCVTMREVDDQVESKASYQIHRSPLRLESWAEAGGVRRVGAFVCDIIQRMVIDRIFGFESSPPHCNLRASAPPQDAGITLDMPTCWNFDTAWRCVRRTIRVRDLIVPTDAGNLRIQPLEEQPDSMKFKEWLDPRVMKKKGFGDGKQDLPLTVTFTFIKEKGLIICERRDMRGGLVGREFAVLHREKPLRLEFWKVATIRNAGPELAAVVQGCLNEVLKRVQSS